MAHFRATIKGSRGEASRLGNNEIRADVNGWNSGVTIQGSIGGITGCDYYLIYSSGGSNNPECGELIGTLRETGRGVVFEPAESEAR